jgi:hypothetical protein
MTRSTNQLRNDLTPDHTEDLLAGSSMTNKTNHVDGSDFIARSEIDELFGHASPNPERIGCPPPEELLLLARRDRPIDDPGYDHLADCSPCYRHVRGLQQAWAHQRTIDWWTRGKWLAAAAVLFMTVAGSAWLQDRPRNISRQPAQTASPETAITRRRVELDLRQFRVSRSPEEQAERAPLVLPQGELTLTLLLAVGFEPGAYDLQLLDGALHAIASASGQAAIRNFVTTLEVTIDVRGMPPGPYELALRRAGEDWHVFPALVK